MSKIVVMSGDFSLSEFTLEAGDLLMGRHTDCQLHRVFQGVPGVSRRHACIRCVEGRYLLEDLGSRNGTLLNGRRITVTTPLRSGDQFYIAGVCFRFIDDGEQVPDVDGSRSEASLHNVDSICSTIHVGQSVTDAIIARDAPRKFQALVDMLTKIGDSLDTDAILARLLDGMLDIFDNAQHGFVAVKGDGDTVEPRFVRHRRPGSEQRVRISQSIVSRVMSGKEAILSQNATTDERFRQNQSVVSQGISSLMCTPLVNRTGESLGVIQLETSGTTPFSARDLEVLASVTPHAAIAIDYARVHAEALQRQAIQRDLEFARQIQRNFLPDQEPQVDGYRFFSYYEAAFQVGGDYYDYLRLPDGRFGVVVADVAGKGVAAGLIMSKFSGEFKYMLSREGTLPGTLARMNDALLDQAEMRFITVAALLLDARSHTVEIVNAGHCDTLMRLARGEVLRIDEDIKGTPIGMFPGQQYRSKSFSLSPGDTLLLYTDGLSEATKGEQSFYGVDRVIRQIGSRHAGADQIGSALLEDVRQFVGDHPQSDDLCLVCIQREREPG